MSFSRAKITRFNDPVSCTPSPADYNVKIEANAKNAVIPRGERFSDDKSPFGECVSSTASVQSTPCFRTPTLPKKKKTIFNLSGRKTKGSDLFSKSKKKDMLAEFADDEELDLEALKDKIVECNNKDLFIKDLTEQIEEMKAQLNDLEVQKEKLTSDRYKFEETCNELKEEHKMMLQNAFLEYDTETHALKTQVHKLETALLYEEEQVKQIRAEAERTKAEFNTQLDITQKSLEDVTATYRSTLESKETKILELQDQITTLEARVENLKQEYEERIAALQKKCKDEVVDLEYTLLESVTEAQSKLDKEKVNFEKRITALTSEHAREKEQLLEEATAKIKQIEEDAKEANVLADIQMQEKYKDIDATWKIAYDKQKTESEAILKECQAISEYSISQCEWEKIEIKNELDAKLKELQKNELENADLIIAMQEAELKCKDLIKDKETLKVDMEKELAQCRLEVQEILQQKKLYEISITKAHETIDTLKKRLLDSDHDVEQLKSELETCELSKLEFEARCNQLRDELDLVGKQNEALEVEYHETLKQHDDRIAELEITLIRKVEEYKAHAMSQFGVLMQQLHDKECDMQAVLEQLHDEHALNENAQALIERAREEIDTVTKENDVLREEVRNVKEGFTNVENERDECELKIAALEVDNNGLRGKLNEMQRINATLINCEDRKEEVEGLLKQLQQIQEKSDSYSQYCDYYKHRALMYEKEFEELEGINKKYIEQSGRYDTLLQQFEALQAQYADLERTNMEQEALIGPFRQQLEDYEQERVGLLSQKAAAECEAKAMGAKYAQLLGHQNLKQKIHYTMDLKAKNYELAEEKRELELKVKSQTKTIDKLTKQLSSLQMQSPRKAKLHSADKENVASPNRTLNNSRVESPGPLRERN